MKLDVHTHVFHPGVAPRAVKASETNFGFKAAGTGLAQDLEAALDRAGLDGAAILFAARGAAQVIPANNLAMDTAAAHPRLIPFGTVHPRFAGFEAELDRLERGGVRGLKFAARFQEFSLDDPGLRPLLEAASGRFVALFHADGKDNAQLLADIHADFPRLSMIVAHLGGVRDWDRSLALLAGKDVCLDTSSIFRSITDAQLTALWNAHPRERIFFGSDSPYFDPATELSRLIERLRPSDAELENLLCGAARLLGLD